MSTVLENIQIATPTFEILDNILNDSNFADFTLDEDARRALYDAHKYKTIVYVEGNEVKVIDTPKEDKNFVPFNDFDTATDLIGYESNINGTLLREIGNYYRANGCMFFYEDAKNIFWSDEYKMFLPTYASITNEPKFSEVKSYRFKNETFRIKMDLLRQKIEFTDLINGEIVPIDYAVFLQNGVDITVTISDKPLDKVTFDRIKLAITLIEK